MTGIAEFLTARYDEEQGAAEDFRSRDWVARGATVRSGPRVQTAAPALYSTRMMGEPWPDEICVPLPTGDRPDDFWTLVNLHGTTGKFESETRHAEYIAYWDPARVLADIAAKRKRLALYAETEERLAQALKDAPWKDDPAFAHMYGRQRININELGGKYAAYRMSVRLDAAAFAEHPDSDPAWRIDD